MSSSVGLESSDPARIGNVFGSDPSRLTTEQLLREIANLRAWAETLQQGSESVMDERFRSVGTQFELIERQRVEQKKDTKDAVDAALAAAKEAVQEQTKASAEAIGKSEALTKTQLEQQAEGFASGIKSVIDKLDDLKDRVVRIETARSGQVDNTKSNQALLGLMISGAAVFISLVVLVVSGVFVK